MKIFKTAMILTASALALTACSETTVTHAPKDTAAKTQSFLTNRPGAGKLTPERINASPSISGATLRRAAISPDGTMVTVLQGRKGARA